MLKAEDLTAEMFKAMEATAKRELQGEAWRMSQKQEVELPSGVHGGKADPEPDDTLRGMFCSVVDRWTSWSGDYVWSEAPVEAPVEDRAITCGDVADWLLADLN
jgi:hypothetical protein